MANTLDNSNVARTLLFIGLVFLAEPLAATMLLSFVVFMVRDFPGVNEHSVPFWCGIITSAFFVAQAFSAPLYGIVSDHFGRKHVLLFGLVGSAICTILFGLSGNLTTAIISRVLCGLFNGNSGVSRTSVGEFAANNGLDQGRAFSIFGLCTAIGTLLGPLLGGFLSRPAEKYNFQGPFELFAGYPYLLPCMIGACYNIMVVALCIPYLQETRVGMARPLSKLTRPEDQETPLIISQETPTLNVAPRRTRKVLLLIVGQAIIALHAISFDEMYPVIAATDLPKGFGLSSNEIAKTLLFLSPVVLATQFVGYPILSKRLKYATLWRVSSVLFLVVYVLFPFTIMLPSNSWIQWSCLYLLLAVRMAAIVIGYTSASILLMMTAPPNQRGMTMSFSQAAVSASRATGPAIAGATWSWGLSNRFETPFDQNILFLFLCIVAILQLATAFGLS